MKSYPWQLASWDARYPDPSQPGTQLRNLLARQKQWMQKKVREAAVHAESQERERIGLELHDNICQMLSSAQLYLSCLTLDNADFEMIKARTAKILSGAINEVRLLSHGIVSPDLQEKGLIESIRCLAEDVQYSRQILIDFDVTDWMNIEAQDAELKLTVYRIVQEQMQNIVKYSQAGHVRIFLQGRNDQLRLQVTDDGVGFDPGTIRKGVGLCGISRRAKLFNGKAVLQTAQGKGCTLMVTIPLELKRIL